MHTKLFSIQDIEKLITLDDCIKIVERVYKLHGNKKIVMPAKLTMDLGESGEWPNYNSYVNSMPGYIGDIDVSGVKVLITNVATGEVTYSYGFPYKENE